MINQLQYSKSCEGTHILLLICYKWLAVERLKKEDTKQHENNIPTLFCSPNNDMHLWLRCFYFTKHYLKILLNLFFMNYRYS